jgi:hypothetical protein
LPVAIAPPGAVGLAIMARRHSPGTGAPPVDLVEKDREDTIISGWRATVTMVGEEAIMAGITPAAMAGDQAILYLTTALASWRVS